MARRRSFRSVEFGLLGGLGVLALPFLVAPVGRSTPVTEMEGRILTVPRPRQIVTVSPQGGAERILFRAGDGQIVGPSATPDGHSIAFILRRSPRPQDSSANVLVVRDEVWVMRRDGTGAHPVRIFVRKRRGLRWVYPPLGEPGARHGLESIDITDDGSRLLIVRGYRAIYTLDADGEALRRVRTVGATATGYTGSDTTGPQFAPGGRKIIAHFATATQESIGTIPVGGGAPDLISTKRHALAPTYSDDGRWIAFTAISASTRAHPRLEGRHTIWIMRADGSGARPVASRPGLEFSNPDFSPDGNRIVFGGSRGSRVIGRESAATYTVNVDGSHLKRIARGVVRFFVGNPEWVH